jgi:DNA (cytosine-5)-methyltransferase 1
MNVLDIFSGIGGFSLGLERAGMRTVAFCEIDPYCRAVLRKHWPDVPIFEDVCKLTAAAVDGIDVICGGFPCQDISSAGNKAGLGGLRSGLWREYARLVGEIRPKYAIVENVSDLLSRGIGDVLGDLAALGFDAEWHCIPASHVGLPQPRDRLWIIAYSSSGRRKGRAERDRERPLLERWPDDDGLGMAQRRARQATSRIRRMDDGLPNGVHRLRALGNAVVPQIPEIIGRAIMQAEGRK